jgi:hypothetical protein
MKTGEIVKKLRLAGKTYGEISKELNIAKSTISYHCKRLNVPIPYDHTKRREDARQKATSRQAEMWREKKQKIASEARDRWTTLKQEPDFLGFLGLYWGEGLKRGMTVGIINSEFEIIKFCIDAFRKIGYDGRMDIFVRYHSDHDKNTCIEYWSDKLGENVRSIKKDWSGNQHRSFTSYGTCTARFNDWKTKTKIDEWLKCWKKDIGP